MTSPTKSCPECGHALTSAAHDVPGTDGRLKVHARNERKVLDQFKTAQDRATDKITKFAGSLSFIYIHTGWFLLWIVVNAGLIGAGVEFDSYPFGLLTLIVSLEAIFLSTFVMVSQNRQSARADLRSELDFETNLRSEIWTVHIGRKLGIDPHEIEGHVKRLLTESEQAMTEGKDPGDILAADTAAADEPETAAVPATPRRKPLASPTVSTPTPEKVAAAGGTDAVPRKTTPKKTVPRTPAPRKVAPVRVTGTGPGSAQSRSSASKP